MTGRNLWRKYIVKSTTKCNEKEWKKLVVCLLTSPLHRRKANTEGKCRFCISTNCTTIFTSTFSFISRLPFTQRYFTYLIVSQFKRLGGYTEKDIGLFLKNCKTLRHSIHDIAWFSRPDAVATRRISDDQVQGQRWPSSRLNLLFTYCLFFRCRREDVDAVESV